MPNEVTPATAIALLKRIYTQSRVDTLFYTDHPLLTMLEKADDFYGEPAAIPIAVSYGVPQGGSHTFSNAQANKTAGDEARFFLERQRSYQLWQLSNEAIMASKKSIGALVDLMIQKGDDAMDNLSRSSGISVWGNRGGRRGAIGAVAGSTITLANKTDVVNFEKGMILVDSLNDGSADAHVLRAGTAEIDSVNRESGVLTTVAAVPGTWVAGDYLFRDGDFKAAMDGIDSWIPAVPRDDASLATPFLSVDRSQDPVRLAGTYFDGSALPIEESMKALLTRIKINGGNPDVMFLNPLDMEGLEISLENSVVRDDSVYANPSGATRGASIGFNHIVIRSGGSKVRVYEDIDCPAGRTYALQMNTWKLHHMGKFPHMATEGMGNLGGRVVEDADSLEFRARWFGNLGCTAPGKNGVGILPAREVI